MSKPLKKGATYEDLCEVPDHFVAEMFDGELYATPRPALPHTRAATILGVILGGAFDRGPGGWVILDEPELHLRADVLVPDLAGWRRERVPRLPASAFMTLAPDWVCEVLSASTEKLDRGAKLRVYAREGVTHVWLVEPLRQTLEVLVLEAGKFTVLESHSGQATVQAAPFAALELDLGELWI